MVVKGFTLRDPLVDKQDCLAGFFVEQIPRLRRRNASCRAGEKRSVQLLFQLRQMPGDHRLGSVKLRSGCGKGRRFVEGDEASELFDTHRRPSQLIIHTKPL